MKTIAESISEFIPLHRDGRIYRGKCLQCEQFTFSVRPDGFVGCSYCLYYDSAEIFLHECQKEYRKIEANFNVMNAEKLQKLRNHERSARSIGNIHEADAYARKIASIERQHPHLMKPQAQPIRARSNPHIDPQQESFSGKFRCSCGASWDLNLVRQMSGLFAEMILEPHRQAGHKLETVG